ncbi:septum formation initiator family protein [Arthrobacter sp. MYb227]|uniref:FtsB family cell division protein n=1 Tax=Arthrobacter sp. MYb227 TaxID=1848601 RepID=UPI002157B603|nr:septum formation initiator family protein [Arthrobacter sp. MYb227]
MTKRRPPMPRAGSGRPAAADHEAAAKGPAAAQPTPRPRSAQSPQEPVTRARSAPEPTLAKVIPLGKINTNGATEARPAQSETGQGKHLGTSSDATHVSAYKPKKSAETKSKPKSTTKPKKQKSSDSERRIEDRALLSGAVRKDVKTAKKQQPKEAQGPAKPIPARSFSGRILALSIAMSVFALLLVPSIGTYARQHEELAVLRDSIAAKESEQENLKDQIARWDDPLYIKQQARDRINLVMPGERNYMVVGTQPTDIPLAEENHSPNEIRTDLPWVDALYDSVQRAATD